MSSDCNIEYDHTAILIQLLEFSAPFVCIDICTRTMTSQPAESVEAVDDSAYQLKTTTQNSESSNDFADINLNDEIGLETLDIRDEVSCTFGFYSLSFWTLKLITYA